LNLEAIKAQKRIYCRPCLDWTERRPHLAGAVGAAIATRCFDLGWVKRMANTRALKITKYGESGFARTFEIKL